MKNRLVKIKFRGDMKSNTFFKGVDCIYSASPGAERAHSTRNLRTPRKFLLLVQGDITFQLPSGGLRLLLFGSSPCPSKILYLNGRAETSPISASYFDIAIANLISLSVTLSTVLSIRFYVAPDGPAVNNPPSMFIEVPA